MRKTKNKKLKYLPRFVLPLLVVVILGAIYEFGVRTVLRHDVMFAISRGDSVSAVANNLARAGIIDSPGVFKFAIRMHGGRVQTGQYEIPAGISAWRLARMLSKGDIATVSIVVPEGLTIKQIKDLLEKNSELTGPVDCGVNVQADVCDLHDGDVFPDTYRVARGTARLAVLELMQKKMDEVYDAWTRAGSIMPTPLRSWGEVVTLASIVQKETPRASEMPVVASVYINRLRKNMRLQADPTVVYALTEGYGDMRGEPLLRGHLKIESPYNTYTNAGLPPAPIANVGRAALRAVLKPADTNYLFFVADGRGGHRFSNNYEEHLQNAADWREIKKMRATTE